MIVWQKEKKEVENLGHSPHQWWSHDGHCRKMGRTKIKAKGNVGHLPHKWTIIIQIQTEIKIQIQKRKRGKRKCWVRHSPHQWTIHPQASHRVSEPPPGDIIIIIIIIIVIIVIMIILIMIRIMRITSGLMKCGVPILPPFTLCSLWSTRLGS